MSDTKLIQISATTIPGAHPGEIPAEIHLFVLAADGTCWWRIAFSENGGFNDGPGQWTQVPPLGAFRSPVAGSVGEDG